MRGSHLYTYLDEYRREFANGIPEETTEVAVRTILEHARSHVPYYARLIPTGALRDPLTALSRMPLLDKDVIRKEFSSLQAADLRRRKWFFNTSGGSTGEPVRLVQDLAFEDRVTAITSLYYHLVGYDYGQPLVRLWGSERDILEGGEGRAAAARAWFANTQTVNAFRMTPNVMVDFIHRLNERPPRLILAYAQALYELATFAEARGLDVATQRAIMTSAGTLYPFMRERIERVFGCRVFNRYGSREVGDIACEVPGFDGLWVAPWGTYVEVIDEAGNPMPDGEEGELVITLLGNFAMPLIRYRIGDRGALATRRIRRPHPQATQSLENVKGRTVDAFRLEDGTIVDGEYFTHLLYFRDWVHRFQVVQKSFEHIVVRIACDTHPPQDAEPEISEGIRALMGARCTVEFEYCREIETPPSGKYRYTISEIL
jgi:phenylacetate-CoA ligase